MALGFEDIMTFRFFRWFGQAAILGLLVPAVTGSQVANAADALPKCAIDPIFTDLQARSELLKLGRDLFYDPILSGNREVACVTCHHPALGTSDGLSLGIGDGGTGMGPARQADAKNHPEQRIPRNAQGLFNLGYSEFSVMFHDGRVERLADGMIRTPLGNRKAEGLLPVLTAQAGFPVLSADEMAGHYTENEIAKAVRQGLLTGPQGARGLLARRVASIPDYRRRFSALGDDLATFQPVARALAAFMAHEWRADESAYDRYICEGEALSKSAEAGRELFYGKAGCAACHGGRFQTDHGFHAIAMPQIGPGKAERFETHSKDTGRMRVTGLAQDAYRFRTPSLRNVVLTAPYGHAGAYTDLEAVIRHHLDPQRAVQEYSLTSATLPELEDVQDDRVLNDAVEQASIVSANTLRPVELSDAEVADLIAFMHALTDRAGVDGRLGSPETVPSGLTVPKP